MNEMDLRIPLDTGNFPCTERTLRLDAGSHYAYLIERHKEEITVIPIYYLDLPKWIAAFEQVAELTNANKLVSKVQDHEDTAANV